MSKNASWDVDYNNSKSWIHKHPIGPAVIEPFIIAGGVNCMIKNYLPTACLVDFSYSFKKPAIVGEVITIKGVVKSAERSKQSSEDFDTEGWMVEVEGWGEDRDKVRKGEGIWKVWVGRDAVERRD